MKDKVPFPGQVKNVVADMWEPFHKAVRRAFPEALIVVDKYHVVQKVTAALDQVRKQYPALKKARFHLLRGYEKVKEKNRPRLDELLENHGELAQGYFLKELYRDFYRSEDYDTADHLLTEWLELAADSPWILFMK